MFSSLTSPAPEEFVEQVKQRWPSAPLSYLEFLSETDGAQLDLFVLYGSGNSQFPSLIDVNDRRGATKSDSDIFIGEDASGEAFLLSSNAAVHSVSSDPPGERLLVAANFDDLLDQVFMGPRYIDYFHTPRGHTDWIDFMKEQQWL